MSTSVAPGTSAESYVGAFDELSSGAAAPASPDWVHAKRRAALERFASLGFPTTKNEDWHYTSVSPIAEHDFTLLSSPSGEIARADLAPFTFGAADWHTIVFVNGRYARELSDCDTLPAGVRLLDLATAWTTAPDAAQRIGTLVSTETQPFTALNAAFMLDGAVVEIAADVKVERPIHLLFVVDANAAKGMMHPRNVIIAGRHSEATVVESYVSTTDAVYFTNAVTEAFVADGATLRHYKMQREGRRAFHVSTTEARQGRDSHFVSFSFGTGGSLSRSNVYTTLAGAGCGATLNGLYMLDGEQHGDHQTQIIHAEPNCFSRELYKGVLDGRSHGVFNGKVYVHPIAQKTDGKQTNNTLLLSDTAQIDTKPQLEIFADDVKCTHGATVGQIDRTALFYLESRGLSATVARRLLTYAFAADVLETIEVGEVRETLEQTALERFV
ncbi:MAG TPA: Fe-S cluster assembly protein SufD [Gemmatimonadaceae bacterium]|nr:Fe-S cluster assembly protein SufD [Gemmatimonadaceae bacterium]